MMRKREYIRAHSEINLLGRNFNGMKVDDVLN